jgi:hypothetical protein
VKVDDVAGKRIVGAIANGVSGFEDGERVAVGMTVLAYAAVAGEVVIFIIGDLVGGIALRAEEFERRGAA